MDIREFLVDAPETCYFTCYELLLRSKDGETHHPQDYSDISEVANITIGGVSIKLVPAGEERKQKKGRYTIVNHRSSFLTLFLVRIAVAPLKKMKILHQVDNCPLRNLQIGRLLEGHWMGAQGLGLVPMLSSPF